MSNYESPMKKHKFKMKKEGCLNLIKNGKNIITIMNDYF